MKKQNCVCAKSHYFPNQGGMPPLPLPQMTSLVYPVEYIYLHLALVTYMIIVCQYYSVRIVHKGRLSNLKSKADITTNTLKH